jgi:hypothetical protein
MLINPRAVEANGAITASKRAAYLKINCQAGVIVGVVVALMGMNKSPSNNPKGSIAAPTMADLDICLFCGSFFGDNGILIS